MKNLLLLMVVSLFGTGFAFGQRVLVNFENVNQTIPGECFGTGGTDGPAIGNCVNILANPDATGLNVSDSVASFIEPAAGETWMGVFFDVDTANSAPLVFAGDSSTLCIDAWLPNNGGVVLKLENPGDGAFGFEPANIANTATNTWEQICHDYAGTAAEARDITRVVVFFNIGEVPTAETTYYWDNLQQLGATSIGGLKFGGFIKAYPNPVTDVLRITDEFTVPHTFVVSDLTGREVLRVENSLDGTLDVSNLINGAYFLRAVNQRTEEIRTTRFLKN
ncbi:MAG: T9SS type A sorting domain-containing protein [Bacteroidia bacterium]